MRNLSSLPFIERRRFGFRLARAGMLCAAAIVPVMGLHAAVEIFTSGRDLTVGANYTPNGVPDATTDVLFDSGYPLSPDNAGFNFGTGATPSNLTVGSLNDFNANSVSLFNITTGAANVTLTLGGNAGQVNAVSGVAGDLIYISGSGVSLGIFGSNVGNGSGGLSVALGASGNFNVAASDGQLSIDAPITGAFGVTKNGAGALTLSGANAFTGGVTLNAGRLNLNGATALGTGTFLINGGSIDNTTGTALTLSTNNLINIANNFAYAGNYDLNLGTGAAALGASRAITVLSTTLSPVRGLTFGGGISGAGFSLTKQGSGTLFLLGANTYTGGTIINGGTLSLGATGTLDSTGGLTLGNGEFFTNNVSGNASRTQTVGTLTNNAGRGTITLATTVFVPNTLTASSLATRLVGSTTLARGTNLGAAPGAGNVNVFFATPPAVTATGNTGAVTYGSFVSTLNTTANLGTTQAAVLRGVLVGNTGPASTGVGFGTYDPTNGIRLLNPTTEQTSVTAGTAYNATSNADNVRISNTSLTINGKTTNTLELNNTNTGTMTVTNSNTSTTAGSAFQPVNGLLFSGSGPITLTGGALVFANSSTVAADQIIFSTNTGGVTIATTLTNAGTFQRSFTFAGPGNFTITGTLSTASNGGNYFNGPGTVTLQTTAYGPSSAGTVINGGTVILGTSFALAATVSRPVLIASGAAFDINNVTVASGNANGFDSLNNVNGAGGTVTNNGGTLTNLPLSLINGSTASNFSGTVSGPINLIVNKQGATTNINQTLTGASTYTGNTSITSSATAQTTAFITLGAGGNLPITTVLTLGGAQTVNGTAYGAGTGSGVLTLGDATAPVNQTLAGLATAGTGTANAVQGGNAQVSVLTINNASNNVFAGLLGGVGTNNNNLALTKFGAGMLTLSGANTYTGKTTVNNGTLLLSSAATAVSSTGSTTSDLQINTNGIVRLGASNQIADTAKIGLSGGTLNLNGRSETTGAGANGVGALTLLATSTIDFGVGNTGSLIQFAGLGLHAAGSVLQILNYTGNPSTGGGTDQLLFAGTTASFTNLYNQADVSFNGASGYGTVQFSGYFEVTPTAVPEPATVLGGCLLAGVLAWRERRRVAQGWKALVG